MTARPDVASPWGLARVADRRAPMPAAPIPQDLPRGNDRPANRRAVLILGMHRSGTSTTAGVLHHLGVAFGSKLMAASAHNPKGYFEHSGIVAVHDELLASLNSRWDDPRRLPPDWIHDARVRAFAARLEEIILADLADQPLWGLKDPRLCRLLPLWLPLLRRLGIQTHCIFVLRHPTAVARSLEKREGMDLNYAGGLWLQHVLQAEAATRSESRLLIDYARLVGDWRTVVGEIGDWLQLDWADLAAPAVSALEGFVDHELQHHVTDDFRVFEPRLAAALEQSYHALLKRPPLPELASALDSIQHEIGDRERYARSVYGPAVGRLHRDLQERQRELERIRGSWSFRAMRPFRAIGRAFSGRRI